MSSLARATGTVLSVPEPFRGKSAKTGNDFTIETVKVLVLDSDLITLNFNRGTDGRIRGLDNVLEFRKGDEIDVVVEVGVYRMDPQFTIVRAWPATSPAASEGIDFRSLGLADSETGALADSFESSSL